MNHGLLNCISLQGLFPITLFFPFVFFILILFKTFSPHPPTQHPAIDVLKEIQVFLEENGEEIVTIFIEDYVKTPKGVMNVFNAAGLNKYWFPVSQMPKNGEDWPSVDDMVKQNQRLVVFTSARSKEATEGIAYEWRYVVENQCEFCSSKSSYSNVSMCQILFKKRLKNG